MSKSAGTLAMIPIAAGLVAALWQTPAWAQTATERALRQESPAPQTVQRPAAPRLERIDPQRLQTRAGPAEGTWVNVDENTRSLTRLHTFRSGDELTVHAWGACTPKDCDWGRASGRIAGGRARVVWDQGFVVRDMRLVFREDVLEVTTQSRYRDGRGARAVSDRFRRLGSDTRDPRALVSQGGWVLQRPAVVGGGRGAEGAPDAGGEPGNAAGEDTGEADAIFDQAIAAAEAEGDPAQLVETHLEIAQSYLQSGKPQEARRYVRKALAVFDPNEAPAHYVGALILVARTYAAAFEPEVAAAGLRYAQRAADFSAERDDRVNLGRALHQLGLSQLAAGNAQAALATLARAYELRRELDDRRGAGRSLAAGAQAYERMARNEARVFPHFDLPIYDEPARAERALRVLEAAMRMHRESDDAPAQWQNLYNRGAILTNLGRAAEAHEHFVAAVTLAQRHGEEERAKDMACSAQVPYQAPDGSGLTCMFSSMGLTAMLTEEVGEDDFWEEYGESTSLPEPGEPPPDEDIYESAAPSMEPQLDDDEDDLPAALESAADEPGAGTPDL